MVGTISNPEVKFKLPPNNASSLFWYLLISLNLNTQEQKPEAPNWIDELMKV